MGKSRREKLIDLGADVLAEALLTVAAESDVAWRLVERLIEPPSDGIVLVKYRLADLKIQGSSGIAGSLRVLPRNWKCFLRI